MTGKFIIVLTAILCLLASPSRAARTPRSSRRGDAPRMRRHGSTGPVHSDPRFQTQAPRCRAAAPRGRTGASQIGKTPGPSLRIDAIKFVYLASSEGDHVGQPDMRDSFVNARTAGFGEL